MQTKLQLKVSPQTAVNEQLLKEEANTMSSYRTLDTILKDYNFFNYEA